MYMPVFRFGFVLKYYNGAILRRIVGSGSGALECIVVCSMPNKWKL